MAVIATRSCRTILILAFAMLAGLWLAVGAQAADKPGRALSSADEARYRAAFADAERGDFDAAAEDLEKVRDRSLIGHVDFVRLMHPTAYRASYDELADWLKANAELGGAERIYALAKKRQPRAARDPKAPSFLSVSTDWMTGAGPIDAGTASFRARDAYYSGRIAEAWALAPDAGEPWIAGLAGWRLGKTEEARRYFLLVAEDDANDDWLRAAAWFWAARCSERLGEAGVARDHFNRAAAAPYTFYGLIAARKLELNGQRSAEAPARSPVAQIDPPSEAAPANPLLWRVSNRDDRKAAGLIEDDPRAHRAAALAQLGRTVEAAQELRVGLATARSEADQKAWQALIISLNIPLQIAPTTAAPPAPAARKKARPYRAEAFDAPDLYPKGGFTLDRALVYAVVRQESRFNPFAYSPAGAVGLMQVRPASAAHASGDDKLLNDIMSLFDPPVNLRAGQDYIGWLIDRGLGGDDDAHDLFRVIAAYNGGAGAVLKTRKRVEPDADALLFMESLPAYETRDYVERVAFGYWTYRRMFGQPTATLDEATRYERRIDMRSDR